MHRYTDTQVSVQNRSVLYAKHDPVLVSEGIHDAELIDVRPFESTFGARVGLVFRLVGGDHNGIELMQSAAATSSPKGKLADLLHGLGGNNGTLDTARALIGKRCRVAVRHDESKAGVRYARIVQTFQSATLHLATVS